MQRENFLDYHATEGEEYQLDDYDALLRYITYLAHHKLGYPVSLLTFVGIVDNTALGIQSGSLANILLNNVGDPFKDSETSRMEVKRHERKLIAMLERYYGLSPGSLRGYVTTGGTEGNFAGIWWSKRFLINKALLSLIETDNAIKLQIKKEQELWAELARIPNNDYQTRAHHLQKLIEVKNVLTEKNNIVQQLLTPTIFYAKDHTHYSIPKVAEILRLNIKPIPANEDGSMDLAELKKELMFHMGAHPYSSAIVIANIGTTITGAIDDVKNMKKILDDTPKLTYTIHLDGALTGFVIPILKPFGEIDNYFDDLGVNTLAFSAHKYPGLSQPCGIVLAKKSFFEKAFEKTERSIEYVGNILDVTITGSRSGLNVLMFYHALCSLGLNKNYEKLKELVSNNLAIAKYLYVELVNIFGVDHVYYPNHFNIIFPKPSMQLAKKYQLMITGEKATICVLNNVNKELIDRFIEEVKRELKNKANVLSSLTIRPEGGFMSMLKLQYKVQPLTEQYMKQVSDLFLESFCNREPITQYLHVNQNEYRPFVSEVLEKAVKDGLSTVAIDKEDHVMAFIIVEDIAEPFMPTLSHYPKLKPIFELLAQLSKPFVDGKMFEKGKVAHFWIAGVDKKYGGQGMFTELDNITIQNMSEKGFSFAYAEFTNEISEKVIHQFKSIELCNRIKYNDFISEDGQKPFDGLKGGAAAYCAAIRPGIQLDALTECYIRH